MGSGASRGFLVGLAIAGVGAGSYTGMGGGDSTLSGASYHAPLDRGLSSTSRPAPEGPASSGDGPIVLGRLDLKEKDGPCH